MYKDLIQSGIVALTRAPRAGKYKRENIVHVINNLKSVIFDGIYVNDQSKSEPDTTDIPDLESEESAAQRRDQKGKGLKVLTPNQMLSR